MKNFNWEDFKNGKIAVHCDTEEKSKDFLKECDKQGIKWVCGDKATHHNRYGRYKERTTYVKTLYGIRYCDDKYYKEEGYKIIKWEIDTMKELTFKEVIANIKEGETWDSGFITIKMTDRHIDIEFNYAPIGDVYSIRKDMKFKLQRKEYSFQEAFEEYEKGGIEIESKETEERYKKVNGKDMIWDDHTKEWEINDCEFYISEIRGAWFIND